VGFDGAPRVLGIDERGREVLSYFRGAVPLRATPEVVTDQALYQVGGLLRSYHEAVSGFELPSGIDWFHEPVSGSRMVVCHNDLAPKNTVFREGRPVAFLDWDLAAPAPPVRDLAYAAWQFVPLSDERGCASNGWTRPPDRPHRLRILCDGYGLPRADRTGFSGAVAERVEATASGIERLAAEGVAAHERLIQEGVPALVRVDKAWVERHTGVLDTALVSQLLALGDGEAKAQRHEDATREPAQDAGEGRAVPEPPSQGSRSERDGAQDDQLHKGESEAETEHL